jgi:hypothetical protein
VCTARVTLPSGHRSNLHTSAKRDDVKRIPITNGIYALQIQAPYQQTPTVLTLNRVDSALVAIVLASHQGRVQLAEILPTECSFDCGSYRRSRPLLKAPGGGRKPKQMGTLRDFGIRPVGVLWGVSSALCFLITSVGQTFIAFGIGAICAASLISFF